MLPFLYILPVSRKKPGTIYNGCRNTFFPLQNVLFFVVVVAVVVVVLVGKEKHFLLSPPSCCSPPSSLLSLPPSLPLLLSSIYPIFQNFILSFLYLFDSLLENQTMSTMLGTDAGSRKSTKIKNKKIITIKRTKASCWATGQCRLACRISLN